MADLIVGFPKIEEAKGLRNLLTRNGFHVIAVCTTGAQVLNYVESMNSGIVVSGCRFPDMGYEELITYLPEEFQMLLVASRQNWGSVPEGRVVPVGLPLKLHDLIDTLNMMAETQYRRRKKKREQPKMRNAEQQEDIRRAKEILMERNDMSEEEAHRYIQKSSMDNGTDMAETAQMILRIMTQR